MSKSTMNIGTMKLSGPLGCIIPIAMMMFPLWLLNAAKLIAKSIDMGENFHLTGELIVRAIGVLIVPFGVLVEFISWFI